MTGEYLNTLWMISIITLTSMLLLPLLAWVIAGFPSNEAEHLS